MIHLIPNTNPFHGHFFSMSSKVRVVSNISIQSDYCEHYMHETWDDSTLTKREDMRTCSYVMIIEPDESEKWPAKKKERTGVADLPRKLTLLGVWWRKQKYVENETETLLPIYNAQKKWKMWLKFAKQRWRRRKKIAIEDENKKMQRTGKVNWAEKNRHSNHH